MLIGLYFGSFTVIGAEPKVELNPSKPTPLSKITFNVEISEQDANNVELYIQECSSKAGICYSDSRKNLVMDKVNDFEYKVSTELIRKEADYIQYNISVETESGWVHYDDLITVNLDLKSNNSGNGGGDNETPGFEIIILILGVAIVIFILGKKRL
jgi:hypothetical protein